MWPMKLPSMALTLKGWLRWYVSRLSLLTKEEFIRLVSEPESINTGRLIDSIVELRITWQHMGWIRHDNVLTTHP